MARDVWKPILKKSVAALMGTPSPAPAEDVTGIKPAHEAAAKRHAVKADMKAGFVGKATAKATHGAEDCEVTRSAGAA